MTMHSPSIEKKVKTKISEKDHGKLLTVTFYMVITIKNNEYYVNKQNLGDTFFFIACCVSVLD